MSDLIQLGPQSFYINRRRYVESESSVKVGIDGYFILEAIKPGVGVMRSCAMPNLITNTGMDSIGNSTQFDYIQLGTGTTSPSYTDTALTAFGVGIGGGSAVYSGSGSSPWYGQAAITWTSTVGGATGVWTEIGVSSTVTTGNLRSHALIVDTFGNPTSFPVLADEQFRGTYIFRVYSPASDNPASITLSGTPYDTITRTLNASLTNYVFGTWRPSITGGGGLFYGNADSSIPYTGGLAAVTAANPLGSNIGSFGAGTVSVAPYTNGNYYIDSGFRWGAGAAVGNIRTLQLGFAGASLQVAYDPVIPKLTTQELIHNQRVTWARA